MFDPSVKSVARVSMVGCLTAKLAPRICSLARCVVPWSILSGRHLPSESRNIKKCNPK